MNSTLRRAALCGLSCCLLTLWLTASSYSQTPAAPAVPEPSPTEAGIAPDKSLTVSATARAHLPESARQAARLSAYRQLMEQGAEFLGVLPASEQTGGYQFFRVNAEHPQDHLLAWALRASVREELSGKDTKVTLTSPPVSELQGDFPQLTRSFQVDVNGDGQMETVGSGYDGRIHVLRKSARGFDRLATSPCLTSYTHVTYTLPGGRSPSWEQVRLTQLESIHSVEVPSPGKVRVVAELQSSEEVAGYFLGKAKEEREVLIRLNEPGSEPEIELQEPHDFSRTAATNISLKGLFRAPEGLRSARLRYNGRPFWQTPEGLSSKRLKMDVVVPLLPGWNSAQVQMLDASQRLLSREVLIRRDCPPPQMQPGRRRALLIGVDRYESPNYESVPSAESDVEGLKRFIMGPQNGAGFALQNVVSLKGEQASRKSILQALRNLRAESASPTDQERIFTLIYFAGLSARSQTGGKSLLPFDAKGLEDGALRAKDLIEAIGPLANQDVLLILDTGHSKLSGASSIPWLDDQDFCETLEQQGWAVLSSGDSTVSQRAGSEGGRFTRLLLQSLQGSGDSDNDGLVEFDELYRNVFDLWLNQGAQGPAPLRRGNLLGRTPVVGIRR